jgi:hypothetical protein
MQASEPAAGLGSGAVAAALEFAQQHLAQFAAAGNMEQVRERSRVVRMDVL